MRVITFQSKDVLNSIIKNGVYFADKDKCREKNDYTSDINQLNGKQPIWVFTNPNIDYNGLKSGDLLERWRCEMSLTQ